MQSNNTVLMSAAGSGKTTFLVDKALSRPDDRIAILTYTRKNLEELHSAFRRRVGHVPAHVTLQTWYEFLLRECARPYQASLYPAHRIEGIYFVEGQTKNYAKRSDIARFYFLSDGVLLSDRASDFVIQCNAASHGAVLRRLCARFTDVYIDEMQDLAGFDWELIELLLRSPIGITLVGDTRQGTFSTNLAAKNKQFRGHRASTLVEQWKAKGLCTVLQRLVSYRCPQSICTLADSLYPAMPATTSMNDHISGHDGLYIVAPAHFEAYMAEFNPTILRYDRRTLTDGLPAFNFGEVKGLTFPRVLIAANGPIQTFLRSGNPTSIKSPAKYYVAFTRAKHSLAFLYGGKCALPGIQTYLPTEPGA